MAAELPRKAAVASPGAPLSTLSPERVNVARQPFSPILINSPSAPDSHSPPTFGHPELGTPGDFSKFSKQGSNHADFKPPVQLAQSTQSAQFIHPQSPGAASNCSTNTSRLDISKWSPPKLHARTNSDVQGMVARFNSLDIKDHADLRKKDAAALKRAQMGREEAEEEVRRLREEARASKKEIDEGKDRERRVAKRLDVVMEDLHRTKETQAHAQALYEKEIRRARKEAFKAASTLVKLQEELKIARKAMGVVQSDLDLERIKGGRREQDAFTAQYQLVGVQEELAQAQARVKVVEEERDALKTTLKEEEVVRIAAEGRIALPTSNGSDDEFASPKKQKLPKLEQTPSKDHKQDLDRLRLALESETRRREQAEEQADFMKMECQFGCCSCQLAQRQGGSFIYDGSFEAEVQKFKDTIATILTPPQSVGMEEESRDCYSPPVIVAPPVNHSQQGDTESSTRSGVYGPEPGSPTSYELQPASDEASNTDTQDTDGNLSDPINPGALNHTANLIDVTEASQDPLVPGCIAARVDTQSPIMHANHEPSEDRRGRDHDLPADSSYDQPFRTVTTTTKVPLVDASTPDYSAFCSPMKLTREEAIEQLRQRRGRARSIAGTPKKPSPDGRTPRRDISAPEARAGATPKKAPKKSR